MAVIGVVEDDQSRTVVGRGGRIVLPIDIVVDVPGLAIGRRCGASVIPEEGGNWRQGDAAEQFIRGCGCQGDYGIIRRRVGCSLQWIDNSLKCGSIAGGGK